MTTAVAPQPTGAPPAGAPPAGTVPAGTIPAGTIPAGTIPAGTAPAGTAPAGTPPPPPAPDPTGDLQKKKTELAKALGDQATLQKSVESLKREVEVLEKAVGEVDKVVQEYKAGLPKLQQDHAALAALLAEHTKEVEAVLGAKAQQVRDAVDKIDGVITAGQADVTDKEKAWTDAVAAQTAAADAATSAEAGFAGLKATLSNEQKKIANATAIKELERKADADNEYKKQAYLLHDLDAALKGLGLIEPDKLKTGLEAAVDALAKKKDEASTAKEKSEAAKAALEDARKKQTEAVAGRTAAITEALKTIV